MKLKQLGFKLKKKRISPDESPLLQQHTSTEKEIPVLSWANAVRLYDKLSIDGFFKGRMAGGITVV